MPYVFLNLDKSSNGHMKNKVLWTSKYFILAIMTKEQMLMLEDSEPDPEVSPGLFQGDMALTNEVSILIIK